MKKLITKIVLATMFLMPLGIALPVGAIVVPTASWNATGTYVVAVNYNSTDFPHDMVLAQDGLGNLTGHGGSPAGANTYLWTIVSGSVSGNTINFTANYTATPDAVTPLTVMTVTGTIANDGTMSGTWSDNYQGGARTGTWHTTSGNAIIIPTTANVTTNSATAITSTSAMLNGTNGTADATGHSFWVSLSPFVTTSPTLPAGVYSTPDLGAIASSTPFSALLSSVTGLPGVTSNTTYYFAAWSNVLGTWYPGTVMHFTTVNNDETGSTGSIGGTVTGGQEGVLHVDSITADPMNANGTADGSFADGWKYTFHITVPTNETNFSMQFGNWFSGSNMLPTAGNMRIFSPQSATNTNEASTVLIPWSNVLSLPMVMTGDTDLTTAGRQVDVVVEVKIPTGTANGSFSTSYGVQTLP